MPAPSSSGVLLAASFDRSSPKLSDQVRAFSEKVARLCRELKIDAPILATKVEGDRLSVKVLAAAHLLSGNPQAADEYLKQQDLSSLAPAPTDAGAASPQGSKALALDIEAELMRLRFS